MKTFLIYFFIFISFIVSAGENTASKNSCETFFNEETKTETKRAEAPLPETASPTTIEDAVRYIKNRISMSESERSINNDALDEMAGSLVKIVGPEKAQSIAENAMYVHALHNIKFIGHALFDKMLIFNDHFFRTITFEIPLTKSEMDHIEDIIEIMDTYSVFENFNSDEHLHKKNINAFAGLIKHRYLLKNKKLSQNEELFQEKRKQSLEQMSLNLMELLNYLDSSIRPYILDTLMEQYYPSFLTIKKKSLEAAVDYMINQKKLDSAQTAQVLKTSFPKFAKIDLLSKDPAPHEEKLDQIIQEVLPTVKMSQKSFPD